MKRFLLLALLFGSFHSVVSQACQNGDTSKVLLVIATSDEGEDNEVIGEIRTSDDKITMLRGNYTLAGVRGNWITVDHFEKIYAFNRLNAHDSVFCFKAIFAE